MSSLWHTLRSTAVRLAGLFRGRRLDRDLSAELQSHLQLHIDDNLRAGMSPAEARRVALLKLGGLQQTKENHRDGRGYTFLEAILQDFRFALRMLAKSPGFAATALLILVLGIGANTAIFSMINAVLLHPYDFHNLDGLVRVWENSGMEESYDARYLSPADATDLSDGVHSFETVATYADQSFNLSAEGAVEPALGCRVSSEFFRVLGIKPVQGRGFSANEEQPGSDQVVILSDAIWKQRFGADKTILGKETKLNSRAYTIVGVMPPKFSFPVPVQLWVPLALTPAQKADRSSLSLTVLARMKSGVSIAQAAAELAAFSQRLQQEYPKTNAGRSLRALQLRKELYVYTIPLFLPLQAGAILVFVLACANLANLMFARLIGRQKEIATRAALGAGWRRLARLLISESIALSLLAGIVATVLSFWTVRLLRTSISEDWTKWVPGWSGIQVDRSVLFFSLILSVLVGLGFGIVTAIHASRASLSAKLKEAGIGSVTPAGGRLRSTLVVVQLVFALVLLVGAGLAIQGFVRLSDLYAGLEPANVLRVEIALPERGYSGDLQTINFYRQLMQSTAALPGVVTAALTSNHPASSVDNETVSFAIEGRPLPQTNHPPSTDLQIVSPGYFEVLHIPLVAGRFFSETDTLSVPHAVIVSRSLAQRYWPGEDAVGKRIKLVKTESDSPWITVVGVVGDVRQNWWNSPSQPLLYRPFLQSPQRFMTSLVRTQASPLASSSSIREIVHHLDPDIAVRGIATMQTEVADSIGIIRIMGILMGIFGFVALALSVIGLYGVLSESVAQRTREIGIRLALGADRPELMKLVLLHALRLTLIGLLFAVPLAFAVSRLLANSVFGLISVNLGALAEFSLLLVVVALVAAYFPARRASRIDPIVALRYE